MRLRAMDVAPGSAFDLGYNDLEGFIDTWREVHYLAQAVAEVGKGWGEAKADDSHSSLSLVDGPGGENGFGSATADPGVFAVLAFEGEIRMALGRSSDGGVAADEAVIRASGKTLEDLLHRVRHVMTDVLGDAKQEAKPAPDMPDHAVASGAPFGFEDVGATYELLAHYGMTHQVLDRFGSAVAGVADDGEEELLPRLWPHHFDLASLLVVAREGSAMTKTIGVGLTPPDAVHASGYWYVSPWSKDAGGAFEASDLPIGHWEERGAMSMAVLPLTDVWAISQKYEDAAGVQACAIAEFVASAFNACMDNFEKN